MGAAADVAHRLHGNAGAAQAEAGGRWRTCAACAVARVAGAADGGAGGDADARRAADRYSGPVGEVLWPPARLGGRLPDTLWRGLSLIPPIPPAVRRAAARPGPRWHRRSLPLPHRPGD